MIKLFLFIKKPLLGFVVGLAVFLFALVPTIAFAQPTGSGPSADDIEGIFNDDADTGNTSANSSANSSLNSTIDNQGTDASSSNSTSAATPQQPAKKMRGVTDLATLEPLKDIAVIQKRFLPKTGRFEAFLGGSAVMNDVFFANYGLQGRLGYYFQERYGVELIGMFFTTIQRDSVKGLLKRGIQTQSFVTPKSYYGADFKWAPIYGKMTWLNKKIVPFDMYFSGGLGTTGTGEAGSDFTVHLGSGQVFAITKSAAFRWDISLNSFEAKSIVAGGSATRYNNLLITLGASFFFPEATYR